MVSWGWVRSGKIMYGATWQAKVGSGKARCGVVREGTAWRGEHWPAPAWPGTACPGRAGIGQARYGKGGEIFSPPFLVSGSASVPPAHHLRPCSSPGVRQNVLEHLPLCVWCHPRPAWGLHKLFESGQSQATTQFRHRSIILIAVAFSGGIPPAHRRWEIPQILERLL